MGVVFFAAAVVFRVAGFRPEQVQVGNGSGDRVNFRGTVDVVEYLGDEQLVHISLADNALVAKLPVGRKLDHNAEFDFSIPREHIYLFDAESEQRARG